MRLTKFVEVKLPQEGQNQREDGCEEIAVVFEIRPKAYLHHYAKREPTGKIKLEQTNNTNRKDMSICNRVTWRAAILV